MIVYYTGTGKSRFAAEAVQRVLNDECVNAFDYIKNREKRQFYFRKAVCFCVPYIFVAHTENF